LEAPIILLKNSKRVWRGLGGVKTIPHATTIVSLRVGEQTNHVQQKFSFSFKEKNIFDASFVSKQSNGVGALVNVLF
jgi:hypothetical protein